MKRNDFCQGDADCPDCAAKRLHSSGRSVAADESSFCQSTAECSDCLETLVDCRCGGH